MKLFSDGPKSKGQTALEYLLIIAGAIAIAAIAVYVAMTSMQTSGETVSTRQENFDTCTTKCLDPACSTMTNCMGSCMASADPSTFTCT